MDNLTPNRNKKKVTMSPKTNNEIIKMQNTKIYGKFENFE